MFNQTTGSSKWGESIIVLPPTAQLQALLTLIRDENTGRCVLRVSGSTNLITTNNSGDFVL